MSAMIWFYIMIMVFVVSRFVFEIVKTIYEYKTEKVRCENAIKQIKQ